MFMGSSCQPIIYATGGFQQTTKYTKNATYPFRRRVGFKMIINVSQLLIYTAKIHCYSALQNAQNAKIYYIYQVC